MSNRLPGISDRLSSKEQRVIFASSQAEGWEPGILDSQALTPIPNFS
ncbi:hypothetical protein H6F95_15675 [Cyanobacteria bacterium FACHB-471]|nr:hypothetical protein [Cyanobacteria bacterium FACHB-471]